MSMAKKRSAGILPFRSRRDGPELFLVHPGGPFWKNKDEGAWSIAKGEIDPAEEPLAAARREFREETSLPLAGTFIELDPVTITSGKEILVWAIEGDLDAAAMKSNTFMIEWPPRSGKVEEFPEADRAAWFAWPVALQKVTAGQVPLLLQLLSILGISATAPVSPPPAEETPRSHSRSVKRTNRKAVSPQER
jgi:predicted NUDIX family NTP pyrophosphohydrolase